jgi:predicted Zn-dependent peptidase
LVVVIAFAAPACIDPRVAEIYGPTSLRSVKVPFQMVRLDNGLHVLLNEDHRVPVVAVDVTYGVGWSDDPPDKPSLAHTFEHLMFQGSAHIAGNGHFQHLERAGTARVGGMTDADRTEYFETVPANQIELALWLESDRMGFLVDSIDQTKVDRVRPVIDNESRQRGDNAIGGHVNDFVLAAVFPEGHPYHTKGAYNADAPRITVEDAKQFGRSYYLPNNAALALSGDFDPATAVVLVDRYFGSLAPGPAPTHVPGKSVSLASSIRLEVAAAVGREEVLLAWPTPALGQAGDAELDVAAWLFNSGFLRHILMEEKSIAFTAKAHQYSFQRAGLFVIRIVLRPNSTAETAIKTLDERFRILRGHSINPSWSTLATREIATDFLQSAQTVAGRASGLGQFDILMHKPGYLWQEIDRYDAIGPSDVRDAIVRYLPEQKRVIVVVHADPSAPVGGRLVKNP